MSALHGVNHYHAVRPCRAIIPRCGDINYRHIGRYSLAIVYWEDSWNATKDVPLGSGKEIADFSLAHWTRLLASLGRKEILAPVFRETQDRVLDGGPLQNLFTGTREGFARMIVDPAIAYRCGTLDLRKVARKLAPGVERNEILLSVPSTESGFSLGSLKAMADELNLGLSAVQRASGVAIVVPSVIHWKLDHYAAIVEQIPEDFPTSMSQFYQYVNVSFHWDRNQYAGLNSTFRSSGDSDDSAVTDYSIARLRRWLTDDNLGNLSGALDFE